MGSLVISFICLTFGAIVIVILRRIAFGPEVKTLFKNSFFWVSIASLTVLLTYIVTSSTTVQAKSDSTANTAEDILPLPPSDTPPKDNKWSGVATDLQAKHQGANFAIYAEDLSDTTRKIEVNANVEVPTASVYKVAIAYSMLQAVSNGLSWDSPLWNTTLDNCFDKMIIESNNECAHAWGDTHGWSVVMDEFAELGFHINLYEQTTSTAQDIAGFLKKLYRSEILNDELVEKLLGTMKKQNYRQGIPAGAPTKVVANKVGFMNGVLNDAGIVFGADGDYVLVILTNGYSWQAITETTVLIDENY
jgi:beta-lactamase class A